MTPERSLDRTEVSLSPFERFQEYLQSRGMRMTQQRRLLLDHVFSRHQHFDADTLIEQMPPSGRPGHVSRPTVYRTLNEFVDAGLLRRFQLGGRSVYEHDYGYPQHDHLYCVECHQLIEFENPALVELLQDAAGEHNFQMTGHRLIISGTCDACRRAKRRSRRKVDFV